MIVKKTTNFVKRKITKKNHSNVGYFVDEKKSKRIIHDPKYNLTLISNRDYYIEIKCPRCMSAFIFINDNNEMHYECKKCKYTMSFLEYQKRYINTNWFKTMEFGVKLYSWDSICPNCENDNPCISYCINQSFGDEQMCYFYPLLLGSVGKLDSFIMKFCRTVNLFPDENKQLIATMFCSKCDAPYSHEFLLKSFLEQKVFDVEFNMKKNVLKDMINLKATDITKLLDNLELMEKYKNDNI